MGNFNKRKKTLLGKENVTIDDFWTICQLREIGQNVGKFHLCAVVWMYPFEAILFINSSITGHRWIFLGCPQKS